MSRKIFNYDNIDEYKIIPKTGKANCFSNAISACGCLFYKIINNELYLLLISYADPKWNKLDDFGGQIEDTDDTILDTILRETNEETNQVITPKLLKNLIDKNINKIFYNKTSKYYSYVIMVDNTFFPNTEIFGDFEKADNFKRTINWYKFDDVLSKLSYRISANPDLIKYLREQINNSINDDE